MWNTIFIEPIYNALIWLVAHVPSANIVIAIAILTFIIKLILAPLTHKSLKSQIVQKLMQPEISRINQEYSDKAERAKHTMELYKKFKTNPLSGCLVLIIQLPIILALYSVFINKGLSAVQPDLLYSFVQAPEHITTTIFGIDMAQKNIIIAIIAGITQGLQLWFSPTRTLVPTPKKTDEEKAKAGFSEQLGSQMQNQMLYITPVLIAVIGATLPAAIAIYWIVSSLFTLAQERLAKPELARIVRAYYSGTHESK